ncbi:MAG: hypothetical protein AAF600_13080 [Bacteroidota bacterium]
MFPTLKTSTEIEINSIPIKLDNDGEFYMDDMETIVDGGKLIYNLRVKRHYDRIPTTYLNDEQFIPVYDTIEIDNIELELLSGETIGLSGREIERKIENALYITG